MSKFEILARREGTVPIAMVGSNDAYVYIAEAFHSASPDHDYKPGWKVVYAIARPTADAWNTFWCFPLTSQTQRIKAACEMAGSFIGLNRETGRYH